MKIQRRLDHCCQMREKSFKMAHGCCGRKANSHMKAGNLRLDGALGRGVREKGRVTGEQRVKRAVPEAAVLSNLVSLCGAIVIGYRSNATLTFSADEIVQVPCTLNERIN